MSEPLVIGDLPFTRRRSPRRKTVGTTINRDGELILTAPADTALELIERVAGEKLLWVHTGWPSAS